MKFEMHITELPSVPILGLPVHNLTMREALCSIDGYIKSRSPHHIVTADASMLVMAQEDAGLRSIICNADLVTPDSAGVLWAARHQREPLHERVSGVEIVERLCQLSGELGYRIYFFGAAPGVAQLAAQRMAQAYPGACMVGCRDGFFKPSDEPEIIAGIAAARPDVLCVALGIPKQEKWIAANREALGVPVLIGVGGTFDVLSGKTRRAPVWMRRLQVEWLWRLLSNPRKISKVKLLPRFWWMVRSKRGLAVSSS